MPIPYHTDYKAHYEYERKFTAILDDVHYKYRALWNKQLFHPQRELNDSIIYDGEQDRDTVKRIEEMRH